jgi:hypothetical protein
MRVQWIGRGFRVTFVIGPKTWPADRQLAHLERRVRGLYREQGLDADPEETSRRCLIYQND